MSQTTIIPLYEQTEGAPSVHDIKRLTPDQIEGVLEGLADRGYISRFVEITGVAAQFVCGDRIVKRYAEREDDLPLSALAITLTPVSDRIAPQIIHVLGLYERQTEWQRKPKPLSPHEIQLVLDELRENYEIVVLGQIHGIGGVIQTTELWQMVAPSGQPSRTREMYVERDSGNRPLSALVLALIVKER